MNWTVILLEAVILTIAFTAMILIPLVKNPVWWIHDYPKDIQEEYFKTHERVPAEFFSPTVLLKKGMAPSGPLEIILPGTDLKMIFNDAKVNVRVTCHGK